MNTYVCRFCGNRLHRSFADLGMAPPSNAYLTEGQISDKEVFYPLHARVCEHCFLVQLPEFQTPEQIFSQYVYFSSYSDTWLTHASDYCDMMIARFGLGNQHQVVEIASNDGYLLQYFARAGLPVLGIEPAANVAQAATDRGIPSLVKFFGSQTARELVAQGTQADVLLGNNVLAHVPALNDFVAGMKILLAARGVITMEFPHLLRLMEENQFDTIYHEHFSYLSLLTVEKVFSTHGLTLFDVEEISTHGGSLRIFARHFEDNSKPVCLSVNSLLSKERSAGLDGIAAYCAFEERVKETKRGLLDFLIQAKRIGKTIVGYGAPAKGNTLLNYCGIRGDFLDYTVDRSPHKQGLFLPGVHIPVFAPEHIFKTRPNYVLILPWNLRDEIVGQMRGVRAWGAQFVTPIPQVEVFD